MSRPSTEREWYSTFHALAPDGAVIGVERMIVPGFFVGMFVGGV